VKLRALPVMSRAPVVALEPVALALASDSESKPARPVQIATPIAIQ
jgi:hypothetical protein